VQKEIARVDVAAAALQFRLQQQAHFKFIVIEKRTAFLMWPFTFYKPSLLNTF